MCLEESKNERVVYSLFSIMYSNEFSLLSVRFIDQNIKFDDESE